MAITLFGIASCDSCRKARSWLEAAGLDYRYHDLRKDGLPETALRAWVRRASWDAVLNRRSATWRRIPEVDRAVDGPEAAMELMKEYPTIIKRPILSSGRVLIIGFDPDEYSDKLSASGS